MVALTSCTQYRRQTALCLSRNSAACVQYSNIEVLPGGSPCLHQAKFCLFCQKICQQEAISSANDFVHRPKFSQLSPKFKDAIEKIWRPTIFCQATNSVVPWKLSFVRSSYFAYMTKFLYLTFLVRQKISHISNANKVVKTKKWWVQNFQDFFCRCTTLFFVVVQTGPKLVYFPCCTVSYIMSLFGLQWWLTSWVYLIKLGL